MERGARRHAHTGVTGSPQVSAHVPGAPAVCPPGALQEVFRGPLRTLSPPPDGAGGIRTVMRPAEVAGTVFGTRLGSEHLLNVHQFLPSGKNP